MQHISHGARGQRSVVSGQWRGKPRQFLANRVIVKFAAPAQTDEMDGAAFFMRSAAFLSESLPGGRVLRKSTTRRTVIDVTGKDDVDVVALATQLDQRDDVEYAEPDVVDHACIVPNDARYVDQWAPGRVGAEAAWDIERGDPSTLIGIIDSGISMTSGALDHGDLSDAGRFTLGTDFVDGGDPRDLNGHGTHVAGIAVAAGNNSLGMAGMSWGSRVYICRTLDTEGNGSSADFADAVEEMTDWALANNVKAIINYSSGGDSNRTKREACQYASDNGMLLVAATGNDGHGPVLYPAAYSTEIEGVIAVGATDRRDVVTDFSNVGPEVTVVAPGQDIFSTMPTYGVTIPGGPEYGALDGTSMATPLVTGLCALVWSRHPELSSIEVRRRLIESAVKLGAGNFDEMWGHGRVDARAALDIST